MKRHEPQIVNYGILDITIYQFSVITIPECPPTAIDCCHLTSLPIVDAASDCRRFASFLIQMDKLWTRARNK